MTLLECSSQKRKQKSHQKCRVSSLTTCRILYLKVSQVNICSLDSIFQLSKTVRICTHFDIANSSPVDSHFLFHMYQGQNFSDIVTHAKCCPIIFNLCHQRSYLNHCIYSKKKDTDMRMLIRTKLLGEKVLK